MKTLFIDCAMGCAGDMLTAALLELHPDREAFLQKMNAVFGGRVLISAAADEKCGIRGTHVSVKIHGEEEGEQEHHHDHGHHHHQIQEKGHGLGQKEAVEAEEMDSLLGSTEREMDAANQQGSQDGGGHGRDNHAIETERTVDDHARQRPQRQGKTGEPGC